MTRDQAERLWLCAGRVGDTSSQPGNHLSDRFGQQPVAHAQIVEIGSFRGRSMIILASAAPEAAEIVAIDPHMGTDRGPQEIVTTEELGNDDNTVFNKNLTGAGVRDRVRHVRKMSADALADVDAPIDLLYIDGAHRYGPARADMVDWASRVAQGGTLLVHDSWSSIGVTGALLRTFGLSSRWRYIGRSQSLAEYRREDLDGKDRRRSTLRQLSELPWFVRNVLIKILLTLKLGRLTRLFGHDGETWPY